MLTIFLSRVVIRRLASLRRPEQWKNNSSIGPTLREEDVEEQGPFAQLVPAR